MTGSDASSGRRDPDEIALERYRYLLRTAPPDAIEAAHAEAFAALSPEQRRKVLDGLAREIPESELHGAQGAEDPQALARLATRAEMAKPGTIERAFEGVPVRGGLLGGLGFGGSFLSMLAGAFIGTSIANTLFLDHGYPPGDPAASETATDSESSSGPEAASGTDEGGTGADEGDGGYGGDDGGFGGDDGGYGDLGGGFGGDGGFDI